MPPYLALLLTVGLVVWLIRRDVATRPAFTAALWIPQLWFLIRGTRNVSFWLGGGLSVSNTSSYIEGSPMDRMIALILMSAAFVVLVRRRFNWQTVVTQNKLLFVLILYYGISTMWSDYPFVAFKRWTKEIGSMMILLVLLTEKNPLEALRAVFVRCAYICFPLSIPLYKYFPQIGRNFGMGGGMQVTGVTGQKNELGEICLVFGIVLLWDLMETYRRQKMEGSRDWRPLYPKLVGLFTGVWLLVASLSQTALVGAVVAVVILVSHRIPVLRRAPWIIVSGTLLVLPLLLAGMTVSGMGGNLAEAIGRDQTFTGRTEIWAKALQLQTNPLLGSGFYSFWLGDRGQEFWDVVATLTTAHSGYVETYLDGGYVGLTLLILALLGAGIKFAARYTSGERTGRISLSVFAATLLLNFSESSFFHLSPLWLTFLLFSFYSPAFVSEEEVAEDPLPLPQASAV